MKIKKLNIVALAAIALYGLAACDKKDHDHDHGDGDGHDHDHPKEEKQASEDDHDHDHDHGGDEIVAGPSGGRVMTLVEPHLELFVTDARKVEIRQVSEELKAEPIGTQVVSLVAGDRANPTELTFAKSGEMLVSNEVLPDGNDFPVVVTIKSGPDDTGKKREKFNLNLADCPECDNKEYACECEHEH